MVCLLLLVSFSDVLVTLEGGQSLFGRPIILSISWESNEICNLLATDLLVFNPDCRYGKRIVQSERKRKKGKKE